MQNLILFDGGVSYIRVNKKKAQRLWENDKPIVISPVKLNPFGPFRPSMLLGNSPEHKERGFEILVRDFQWYNCNLNETGSYAAFYTPKTEEK